MIASMYGLDHRIAELRPSEAELRLARQRRDARDEAERVARTAAAGSGRDAHARPAAARPSRAGAG